jgi:glycosyltransferase involved in cell wall biosynthesis
MSASERAATLPRRATVGLRSRSWRDHSRLVLPDAGGGWVLGEEARSLSPVFRRLGIRLAPATWAPYVRRQCVFHLNHFSVLRGAWRPPRSRIALAYLHGRPGTPYAPEFDEAYASLRRHHDDIARVRVSHREMRDIVLSAGVDEARVFTIPLGVDAVAFRPSSPEERAAARAQLDVEGDAFLVGSLQKDGVGWGSGDEPKLMKGPDVLVETAAALHARVPETVVVLTGPARGFVKRGLEEKGVPYVHVVLDGYAELARIFHALDVCVVTSRQEGGPKAVLESMATGIPLVTTRVGQATDLVVDGENGFLVDVGDVDGLLERLLLVRRGRDGLAALRASARRTAEANDYAQQLPLWRAFMTGFVEMGED